MVQLNNEGVQKSIIAALKEDDNFARFLHNAPVSDLMTCLFAPLRCCTAAVVSCCPCLSEHLVHANIMLFCHDFCACPVGMMLGVRNTCTMYSIAVQAPLTLALPPPSVEIEEVDEAAVVQLNLCSMIACV